MQENMLLSGNVQKGLLKYSIPIILSMLTTQLYAVVDTMIIGLKLDANALAAVSNASTVLMIFLFISGGLELGGNLLIGSQKPVLSKEDLSKLTYNILFANIVIALILTIVGIILFPTFLSIINTPAEIMEEAVTYGTVYLLGLPFLMFYDISKQIFMGAGDSKTPMLWVIITSVINIVLDLIFVEIWGIGGAAFATALSQVVGAIVFAVLLKRHLLIQKFTFKLVDVKCLKENMRLSIPNMLQQMTGPIAFNIRQGLLGTLGVAAIAGFSCANKITTLVLMGVGGFCQGLVIFIAQNLAAAQKDRMKDGIRVMTKIMIAFVTVMVLICFFGRNILMSLFTSDTEAIAYGSIILMYEPISLFVAIIARIQESKLRGHKKMLAYTCSSLSTTAVNVIAALILVPWIGFSGFFLASYISHTYSAIVSTVMAKKLKYI